MTVLVKLQIEIRFSIELYGNSKLSMTSCPPSSGFGVLLSRLPESLILIGSAMFGATFNLVTRVDLIRWHGRV